MEQQEIQTLRALMEYEAARTAPPESFPDLPDIPAGRYTDPRFFELEQAEIFKNPGSLPHTSMRSLNPAAT